MYWDIDFFVYISGRLSIRAAVGLTPARSLVCKGVGVWVCGCVGVWVCGCVGVGVLGVGVALYVYLPGNCIYRYKFMYT